MEAENGRLRETVEMLSRQVAVSDRLNEKLQTMLDREVERANQLHGDMSSIRTKSGVVANLLLDIMDSTKSVEAVAATEYVPKKDASLRAVDAALQQQDQEPREPLPKFFQQPRSDEPISAPE